MECLFFFVYIVVVVAVVVFKTIFLQFVFILIKWSFCNLLLHRTLCRNSNRGYAYIKEPHHEKAFYSLP